MLALFNGTAGVVDPADARSALGDIGLRAFQALDAMNLMDFSHDARGEGRSEAEELLREIILEWHDEERSRQTPGAGEPEALLARAA